MRGLVFITVLFLGALALAVPHPAEDSAPPSKAISGRQAVVTPPPCQAILPAPTEEETKARFDRFAYAFLVTKNITNAFEYISSVYINHNPLATANGPNAALDILGPIWGGLDITVLRTTFKGNMGWLNYQVRGLGEIVDRYRFEDGCIVEHWDQGEKFPSTSSTSSQLSTSTFSRTSTTTSIRPITTTTTTTLRQPTTTAPAGPQQARYGQCGGVNWSGPTVCQSPWTCKFSNNWYSQCL